MDFFFFSNLFHKRIYKLETPEYDYFVKTENFVAKIRSS